MICNGDSGFVRSTKCTAVIPVAISNEEVRANISMVQAELPVAFWTDLRSEGLIPLT